jgi:hypothetical protein
MGLKDLSHKAAVALGLAEDKTVADEAAEALAREAEKRREKDK